MYFKQVYGSTLLPQNKCFEKQSNIVTETMHTAHGFVGTIEQMGRSKKDLYPTHRGSFRRPGRGEGNCPKYALHLYRMPAERGVADFLLGGYGSFLERPNTTQCNYSALQFEVFSKSKEIKFSSVTNASTLTSIQNIKFKYTARQCLFINLHVPQRHQFLPLNWLIAVVVTKNETHWAACKHTKVAKFNFYYHIFQ